MLQVLGVLGAASLLLWRSLVLAWQMSPVSGIAPLADREREQALAHLIQYDPERAEQHLLATVRAQPTDAKALAQLATLWQSQAKLVAADHAITLAAMLAPAQPQVQQETARYWLARGQLAPALQAWFQLLQGRPQQQTVLFPILMQLVETPAWRDTLLHQLPTPLPEWWPDFMTYTAGRTRSLEALLALLQGYRMREPVKAVVQTAVLGRLERDAPYARYYTAWLELLTPEQRQNVRYLYDGGFEQPLADAGFGWRVQLHSGIEVDRFESPVTGGSALRVQFSAPAKPGEIVRQALFLAPGNYQLGGKALLRGLYSQGGVEWRILCADRPNQEPVTPGPIFMGDAAWHDFGFDLKIGLECQRPMLQLWLRASQQTRVVPQGEIWVDRLNLRRVGG